MYSKEFIDRMKAEIAAWEARHGKEFATEE